MATLYKGKVKEDIVKQFSSLGYYVSTKILNSKDFGVPQSRERLFYIGLKDKSFNFPSPLFEEGEYVTCREALDDLPSLENLVEISEYSSNESSDYQKLIKNASRELKNHQPNLDIYFLLNSLALDVRSFMMRWHAGENQTSFP